MKPSTHNSSTHNLSPVTESSNSAQILTLNGDEHSPYMQHKRSMRMGLLILLLGMGGFVAWAALAPLDEGVPTEGVVNIESSHKVIQHYTGGIVSQILVREGQEIHAGDVLIKLDDTAIQAKADELKQHYLGLRAQESRLQTEKMGLSQIAFHPDVLQNQNDPYVRQHMINQTQLLRAKQEALHAEVQGLQESIQGQQALIEGYQGVLVSYRAQLTLLNEQLEGLRPLVKEGYAPRNQQNDLEQKIVQIVGQVAETESNVLRSRKSILELQQRISARQQAEKKDIDSEMAQVTLAVQSDAERYKPIKSELGRINILAPASGQVVGLQVHTLGAVVQPGQKIMDIVPVGEPLILDAKIPPHLIDKIHAGQEADVRFSSFANSPQLLLQGQVKTVSKDLLTDQSNGALPVSYYLARITITEQGMRELGKRTLQPGMPVQIVIRTGERTLFTYLMHPLVKRIAASMKEE
jgi:membrane fusion protein, protease secretion system